MQKPFLILLAFIITGCSTLAVYNWNSRYGISDPTRFDTPTGGGTISYETQVKPILDQRCVVCHACYDAPCQLKLGSYEGITRGGNANYIYNSSRLLAADTTRLHHDAQFTSQWRQKNFFPVLNERDNTPEANIGASVMAQLLLQKQNHPLPQSKTLPKSFDFKLHRDQQCTDIESYADYKRDYPLWGMPYGLPSLSQQEHETLLQWIEEGAPYDLELSTTPAQQIEIDKWEQFLNQDSLKAQLMSRYIYEHLFIAHLYFSDDNEPVFFEIVRSTTPPSEPIALISTRRPYDAPGATRVYYRLRPVKDTIVLKTHMPYLLNQERMQKWTTWFLDAEYKVTSLPSYETKFASNPFLTFQQIPSYARYRFMLEEAQFTIMGFIKSPVCRGQVALSVINDHFWVAFTDPEAQKFELSDKFLDKHVNQLQLPAEASSSAGLLNWRRYAKQEIIYANARIDSLNRNVNKLFDVNLDLLWDGDGHNKNAALTIFKHNDSATVIKGLHGDKPQTAWVIGYPLLERIHYLLVAGFDVYGNVGHQLNTRIYMDFLRMEGEFNFLALLPKDKRRTIRNHWYRGSLDRVKEHIYQYSDNYIGKTSIDFKTDDPLQELYINLREKLDPVLSKEYEYSNGFKDGSTLEALSELDNIVGVAASIMPQSTIMEVIDQANGNSEYYSINSNSAYSNISHLLGDNDRRLPAEDSLTVSHGILASYPNAYLQLEKGKLNHLLDHIRGLKNLKDYEAMLDQFAIRRNSDQFWPFSDRLHQTLQARKPIEYGLLDYNRLDNQ